MISEDIINMINNNLLYVLNLSENQINNIDVLKCLENNHFLNELNLS